jgi:hypothetical protein
MTTSRSVNVDSALSFCFQRNMARDKLAQVQLLTRMVDVDRAIQFVGQVRDKLRERDAAQVFDGWRRHEITSSTR